VASVAIPGGTVAVFESGDVDLAAAQERLEQQRATLRGEIERAERKLANAGFVAKAPPAVVEAERAKLERLRSELEAL
jgi:valyl-tRNA synthetase